MIRQKYLTSLSPRRKNERYFLGSREKTREEKKRGKEKRASTVREGSFRRGSIALEKQDSRVLETGDYCQRQTAERSRRNSSFKEQPSLRNSRAFAFDQRPSSGRSAKRTRPFPFDSSSHRRSDHFRFLRRWTDETIFQMLPMEFLRPLGDTPWKIPTCDPLEFINFFPFLLLLVILLLVEKYVIYYRN